MNSVAELGFFIRQSRSHRRSLEANSRAALSYMSKGGHLEPLTRTSNTSTAMIDQIESNRNGLLVYNVVPSAMQVIDLPNQL